VRRVLLVLRGPIDVETVKLRCGPLFAEEAELAVCYQLPQGSHGFHDMLSAQRTMTGALRQACGSRAESIAIFAITEREGDRVEDCARAWGATEVNA
jgi:hypothetical protein